MLRRFLATQTFVPECPSPPAQCDLAALTQFVQRAAPNLAVITGAGISTTSGIPCYRGEHGSYSKGHEPMEHADFIRSPTKRKRFWARSVRGFRYFNQRPASETHRLLASLEQRDIVGGLVTQNVDRLHHRAGHKHVVELHGRGDLVRCLSCDHTETRLQWTEQLEQLNKEWITAHGLAPISPNGGGNNEDIRADGDSHITSDAFDQFLVPDCASCSHEVVMPDLVFFGGTLKKDVKEAAAKVIEDCDALLILGSSCSTLSCFRLVRACSQAGKPIAMVNIGETRVDDMIDVVKIEGHVDEVLSHVSQAL